MRDTSIFSITCLCGRPVEWNDATPEARCLWCKRILRVEDWPNAALIEISQEGRE